MKRRLVYLVLVLVAVVGLAGGGWAAWTYGVGAGGPMQKARALADKGDLRGAQVELRNAIRAEPRNAQAHLEMAKLQMKLADPVAAEVEFRAARATGADPGEIAPLLGEALIAEGKNEEVLKTVPAGGPTTALAARDLLMRSVAQLALNDRRGAQETLGQIRRVAPDSVEAKLIDARLVAAAGDQAATEAKVQAILKQDPTQIDALLMEEQLATLRDDHKEGLALAQRAVASAPTSAMARMRLANQYLFFDQDAKAQEQVDAVLAVQPRFIEAVYLRALIMARAGKLEAAQTEMEKLSSVSGKFPQALYYQALLAIKLNRPETAVDFAKRYNTLVPGDPDGVRLLAQTLIATKQPGQAAELLDKAAAGGMNDAPTLDLLGTAYSLSGNTSRALDAFKEASRLAPKDATILAHYGVALVQAGRNADAKSELEKSAEMTPEFNPTAGEALVTAAIGTGDLDKAEAELAKVKAGGASDEGVGLLTAMIDVLRGHPEAAQTELTEALKKFPDSRPLKIDLAKVTASLGQRAEAMKLLQAVLAKNPDDVAAIYTYVPLLVQDRQAVTAQSVLEAARKKNSTQVGLTVMLSDVMLMTGDPQRALAMLAEARTNGPKPTPTPVMAALARAQTAAGDRKGAEGSYREILAQAPDNLMVRTDLVRLLLLEQDVPGAHAALMDGLKASPGNFPVMTDLVMLAARSGGPDKALAEADALRADAANMPNAALLRGDALARGSKFKEAGAAYAAEFKAAPSGVLLMRAVAAMVAGQEYDTATAMLRDWVKQHPDTPDAEQALAQLDIRAKRWPDAEANLQKVLAARPNDPLATNNLAWVYFQTGDARAKDLAQKSYLRNPTPDAADTLGWILVREGDVKGGLALLQRAGAARPGDPSVQYHLAAALKADGQGAAAAKVLQPVLASNDAFEDRPDAVRLMGELPRP